MAQLNVYKEVSVPSSVVPDAWYLIKEGANPYFTLRVADSSGTLIPLSVDVLGTLLAGYSAGANTPIDSSDNILQAFQKAQGQINNLNNLVAGGVKIPLPLDCSGNPNYPAGDPGDSYIVTVAGRIGGASGPEVQTGDVINCLTTNAGGDQATVGDDWYIIETNQGEADDTTPGYVRRATVAEVNAGTDVNAYVTSGRLRAGVRATNLAGITSALSTPITGSDTVLTGFGKLQGQVNQRVVANASITGQTRAKITYDAKGLVTGGADLEESDIPQLSISKITGLSSQLGDFVDKTSDEDIDGRKTFDHPIQFNYSLPSVDGSAGSGDSIEEGFHISPNNDGADPNYPAVGTIATFKVDDNRGFQLHSSITGGLSVRGLHPVSGSTWQALLYESRQVNTGTGLSGGGNLTANRTLEFDTAWGDARYALASALASYVPTSRTISTNNGLTGGGNLSANRTLSLTGQALAFHNLSSSGIVARTGSGTVAARTLTGSDSIEVTNGNGVSGNPTFKMKYAGTPAW